jgi:ligand-binding sensor domain-containing protein/signal transduction histidine kinase
MFFITSKGEYGKKNFHSKLQLILLLYIISLLFISCDSTQDNSTDNLSFPKILITDGFTINPDSSHLPVVIKAITPNPVKVKLKPEIPEISPIRPSSGAKKLNILPPQIKRPGENGLLSPSIVKAVSTPVYCKSPDVVLVKDAYIKDINPHNFSNFSKLQGLRHDQIRSMTLDSLGNLWLGTDDGLTRYDGKHFSHYTTKQGLNNNLILSVFYNSRGELWFGTFRGGVTKYDGKYLTIYTTENGLSNNVVNWITEDSSGNMWFATGNGAVKFDGTNFITYREENGLANNDVRAIEEDFEGNIWIGTYGGGVSVLKGGSFYNYSEKEGLSQDFILYLYPDNLGNMWIGTTGKGLVKYSDYSFEQYTKEEGLCSNNVRSVFEDSNGDIWIGTADGGLSRYDGTFFTNFTTNEGLASMYIRTVLQDREGNIWIGTRGAGLTRYDGDIFTHYMHNEGLSNSRVMSITEDRDGNMWFGTYGGYVTRSSVRDSNGIRKRYFSTFGLEEGLFSSRIYSVIEDSRGDIWFGSDGNGITKYDGEYTYNYSENNGLCFNSIRTIFEDKSGYLWIGSYGLGVSKFDGTNFTNYSINEGLSSNNILCINQDNDGNIWFGTDGGGVTKFDGQHFTHFNVRSGFFNNTVYSIKIDKNDNIWFGTGGDGVVKYDGVKFTSYSEESGLNNSHVLSLLIDSRGNLWAGTRFGVNLLESESILKSRDLNASPLFLSYGYDDGFLGIGCNLDAIYEDKDGNIWVGTNDRLTKIKPQSKKNNQSSLNLRIYKIGLFNEDIPWTELVEKRDTSILLKNGINAGKIVFNGISSWYTLPENLKLSHRQNYISISYIGISHKNSKKIRYHYKLDGLDASWSSLSDKTEVTYGNLNPGKYNFKVRALSSEGNWSNEQSFKFTIMSPWWKSWWFYLFIIILFVISVYSLIISREKRLIKDKNRLEKKVAVQTRELTDKNRELLIANGEKDKLFSIIAHDLKGPFSSFLGLTQLMADESQDLTKDEVKDFALSMNSSATNLYNLLENLLQWSRMQQSEIPYTPAAINISALVREVMALLNPAADKKEIEIINDIPEKLFIFADSNMFMTVIRNLISNAIKFTPHRGKVNISAKDRGDGFIEVSIKDSGIGMSSDIIGGLFRIDTKKNRYGTDGEASSGLGLMICKEFIEKQGGEIWVESIEGKGSEFIFTLPSKSK